MTTPTMIRKKPRRFDSTESSSSAETAPSKPPKDVLELGQHLVRELGFEEGVDTLGRWMSHHVAELIDQAENGHTKTERLNARKKATETILKIWRYRDTLPGNANPLTPYKEILPILKRLRPDNNPFKRFGYDANTKKEQLAAVLFDNLSRLVIALLLMRLSIPSKLADVDGVAVHALSKAEQQVLSILQEWVELLDLTPSAPKRKLKPAKNTDSDKVNLNKLALQLIDNVSDTLVELKTELQMSADKP